MSYLLDDDKTWVQRDFGLDRRLVKALSKIGFVYPTMVQAKSIPIALQGKDILVRARTGSGKTVAFALPALQKILTAKESDASESNFTAGGAASSSIQCIILAPTKELTKQIEQHVRDLMYYCHDVVTVCSLADDSTQVQKYKMASKPDIVVSTPARLVQQIKSTSIDLSTCKTLIIDEADLVLSFGYANDIHVITSSMPKIFQGILMSATLSPELDKFKRVLLHNPAVLKLEESTDAGSNLLQFYLETTEQDKFLTLYVFLKLGLLQGKGLIFVNDVNKCYRLKLFLQQFFISAAVLNAEVPLNSRIHILEEYNRGVFDYLIATDASVDDGEQDEDEEGEEGEEEGETELEAGSGGSSGGEGSDGDHDVDDEAEQEEDEEEEEKGEEGSLQVGSDKEEEEEGEEGGLQVGSDNEEEDEGEEGGLQVGSDNEEEEEGVEGGLLVGSYNEEEEEGEEASETAAGRKRSSSSSSKSADQKATKKQKLEKTKGKKANKGSSSSSSSSSSKKGDSDYGVSRGIDFQGVNFVINFDFPLTAAAYTHRIGRTARGIAAGGGGRKAASGTALSFLTSYERAVKGKSESDRVRAVAEREVLMEVRMQQPRLGIVEGDNILAAISSSSSSTGARDGINNYKNGHSGNNSIDAENSTGTITTARNMSSEWDNLSDPHMQPTLLLFNMQELESFRYRVEDTIRSVTSAAVKELRNAELKREILNSEKLKSYFAENPNDLKVLRHDKAILHPIRVMDHLKFVPEYLIPASMRAVAKVKAKKRRNKKKPSSSSANAAGGGKKGPQGSSSAQRIAKSKQNDPLRNLPSLDDVTGGTDGGTSLVERGNVEQSGEGMQRGRISGRKEWQMRHKKGNFNPKAAKSAQHRTPGSFIKSKNYK